MACCKRCGASHEEALLSLLSLSQKGTSWFLKADAYLDFGLLGRVDDDVDLRLGLALLGRRRGQGFDLLLCS